MILVNSTSNVAGIGANAQNPDPLKVPAKAAKKYKKRNLMNFLQFTKRNPPIK